MKGKFINYFMDVAERTSQLSHAIRLKVGAIIVKDDRIISIGYNGMPSGWDNNCEDKVYPNEWNIDNVEWMYKDDNEKPYNLKTKPEVLHAETNCISKLAKGTESGDNAIMFCTHAPCIDCAKLIYQSGINTVYYRTQYRSDDGINFLNKSGVNVHKFADSV
jgi:dCMP deaminase